MDDKVSKSPLEKLKDLVSPKSTAGLLRDRKSKLDAEIEAQSNGATVESYGAKKKQ